MEAHHEVDYVDVGHVCGAAEDGRYLESVDSAGVWDDPFAFSTEGKPGQKIPVLTVGCRQILLQPLGAGPRRPGHVGMHRRPFPRAPAAGTRSAPGRSSGCAVVSRTPIPTCPAGCCVRHKVTAWLASGRHLAISACHSMAPVLAERTSISAREPYRRMAR